jgi:hypothetical protein
VGQTPKGTDSSHRRFFDAREAIQYSRRKCNSSISQLTSNLRLTTDRSILSVLKERREASQSARDGSMLKEPKYCLALPAPGNEDRQFDWRIEEGVNKRIKGLYSLCKRRSKRRGIPTFQRLVSVSWLQASDIGLCRTRGFTQFPMFVIVGSRVAFCRATDRLGWLFSPRIQHISGSSLKRTRAESRQMKRNMVGHLLSSPFLHNLAWV